MSPKEAYELLASKLSGEEKRALDVMYARLSGTEQGEALDKAPARPDWWARAVVLLIAAFGGHFLYDTFRERPVTRDEVEIVTLGLRKNADSLQLWTPVGVKAGEGSVDGTQVLILSRLATTPPDVRFKSPMARLWVDDGFPKDRPPKLMYANAEVLVRGHADGKFYVHFKGLPKQLCEGLEFSVCE